MYQMQFSNIKRVQLKKKKKNFHGVHIRHFGFGCFFLSFCSIQRVLVKTFLFSIQAKRIREEREYGSFYGWIGVMDCVCVLVQNLSVGTNGARVIVCVRKCCYVESWIAANTCTIRPTTLQLFDTYWTIFPLKSGAVQYSLFIYFCCCFHCFYICIIFFSLLNMIRCGQIGPFTNRIFYNWQIIRERSSELYLFIVPAFRVFKHK